MNNITKTVWNLLNADSSLRRGLSRGIINKRALANYIIKQTGITAPINAVISAVRRYEDENPSKDSFKDAFNVIANSTMSSKNGVVSLALEKDVETERILPKLFSVIEAGKNDVLRIIQADESIKVLIDKKNLKKTKDIIPNNKIKKIDYDLAEVTLHLNEKAWFTPGIAAIITSELSISNINIVEIMSCIPEIIIFFKEKDLIKAYNILYELCKRKGK